MTTLDFPDPMNAADLFIDANIRAGRAERIAIVHGSEEVTYGQLLENVNRTGNALRTLGTRMEERVMLLLLDCPEFAYAFFGAIKIGAVPVPVNTLLKPQDYEYLLNDSRARVLVVSEQLLGQIEPIRSRLRHLRVLIVVGTTEPKGDFNFAEIIAAAERELEPEPLSKDDPCFWLYSSGT